MTGLIDLQEPPVPRATAPLTIWLLRYWNRHTDQVMLFASYQAALGVIDDLNAAIGELTAHRDRLAGELQIMADRPWLTGLGDAEASSA